MADEPTDARGAPKGSFGNVDHQITDERRAMVEKLAALQVTQAEIAEVMNISADTIQRHYAVEFRRGRVNQGVKLREHAYRMAYGIPNDIDDPSKGFKREPEEKMTRFLLERQHGMVQETRNQHTITELSPEAAAWLGKEGS